MGGTSSTLPGTEAEAAALGLSQAVVEEYKNRVVYAPGEPTAAYVEPGKCYFSEEWAPAPLVKRQWISPDTIVLDFGLSDEAPLNLSTCACILASATIDDEVVVRPYTPVSTNAQLGSFSLMVKVYAQGKLSAHLAKMNVGDNVNFKHIPFNVKIQYPFNSVKKIGMLVGGTGVTPMIQALHAVLGTATDQAEVTMLYGSQTSTNILAKEILDAWEAKFPQRLKVTHVLSNEAADSDWQGAKGFITKDLIAAHLPKPDEDALIFVCGPPPMYAALCGPRDKPDEISGALADLGFTAAQVVKF